MEIIKAIVVIALTNAAIIHSLNKLGFISFWEDAANKYKYVPDFCVWCVCFELNLIFWLIAVIYTGNPIQHVILWLPSTALTFHYVKGVR